jgi:hypothetical protein
MSLSLPLQAMPSMQTAPVSFPPTQIDQFRRSSLTPLPEVAVSLNTNEVQVLSRSGADWTPVETLSEVMPWCR